MAYMATVSRPARDAWVEIYELSLAEEVDALSRPARDAWVEIRFPAASCRIAMTSRPARDAWVEIPADFTNQNQNPVASRK